MVCKGGHLRVTAKFPFVLFNEGMTSPKESTLVNTVYQYSVSHANL